MDGKRSLPSKAELHRLFVYDATTGRLLPRTGKKAGQPIGSRNWNGRLVIYIEGRRYFHSRLVYAYHYNDPGAFDVDHIDRDPTNDKVENLRPATRSQNRANSCASRQNVKSGIKGVKLHSSGRYQARIKVKGKLLHLGTFFCKEAAAKRYAQAAAYYFGEFGYAG